MCEDILFTGLLGLGTFGISYLFGSMSSSDNKKVRDIKNAVKIDMNNALSLKHFPVYGYVEKCNLEAEYPIYDGNYSMISRELLTYKIIRETNSRDNIVNGYPKRSYHFSNKLIPVGNIPLIFCNPILARLNINNLYNSTGIHSITFNLDREMNLLIPKTKLYSNFIQETTNQINVNQINSSNDESFIPVEKNLGTKEVCYGFLNNTPVTILGNFTKNSISEHPSKYNLISTRSLYDIQNELENSVILYNTMRGVFLGITVVLGFITGIKMTYLLNSNQNR